MTDPTASGYDAAQAAAHLTQQATAAPGWYPDAQGQQRWWDGYAWTDHVAGPAVPAAAFAYGTPARPELPAGVRVNTVAIWVVSIATFASAIPLFFFDTSAFLDDAIRAGSSGSSSLSGELVGLYIAAYGLAFAAYAATVVAAYVDWKHLLALGAVRPFHWAFAFIPWALVYLIGRHVVLRTMRASGGAPLWTHVALYAVTIVASFVWTLVVTMQMLSAIPGLR
ncbi:DUF2510 domain-containing protein [Salinibacterium sp. ZJ77]|uniref:DUF2510 domain-containing protein n=1 Tax=Salinibacterium sp. ZJ77 TaxID=2708337 RepID=UPI0014206698|nr:DUF2510 domain-containing protein [Salinibacterium sp. ZJ77]